MIDSDTIIREQIHELANEGNDLDDIYVNDGNDAWGDDAACTRAEAEALIAEWGSGSLGDLLSARDWMRVNNPS